MKKFTTKASYEQKKEDSRQVIKGKENIADIIKFLEKENKEAKKMADKTWDEIQEAVHRCGCSDQRFRADAPAHHSLDRRPQIHDFQSEGHCPIPGAESWWSGRSLHRDAGESGAVSVL